MLTSVVAPEASQIQPGPRVSRNGTPNARHEAQASDASVSVETLPFAGTEEAIATTAVQPLTKKPPPFIRTITRRKGAALLVPTHSIDFPRSTKTCTPVSAVRPWHSLVTVTHSPRECADSLWSFVSLRSVRQGKGADEHENDEAKSLVDHGDGGSGRAPESTSRCARFFMHHVLIPGSPIQRHRGPRSDHLPMDFLRRIVRLRSLSAQFGRSAHCDTIQCSWRPAALRMAAIGEDSKPVARPPPVPCCMSLCLCL